MRMSNNRIQILTIKQLLHGAPAKPDQASRKAAERFF